MMAAPGSTRRLCGTVFLSVGMGLLLFAIAAYGWRSVEQHRLASEWQYQNLAGSAVPGPSTHNDAITLLVIPKINMQAAILDGTNTRSLLLAPGHIENTAWPGDPGNAVIAAHRDTFFHDLDRLDLGDAIYVRRSGRKYGYVVTDKFTVSPDEIAVTYPSADTRLTLITCYPVNYLGPAPKRLIVIAKLQSSEQKQANISGWHKTP
jgi:LPXTG-site transpeptidase (sortase) family protein